MATNPYTASFIIAKLRRQGWIPANNGNASSLSNADLCSALDDEAQLYMTALIKSARENHLVVSEDITIVAGTASYRINSRAVANSLTAVFQVSNSAPVPLSQLSTYRSTDYGTSGTPEGFELVGASIVLRPTPSSSGTLRVRYLQRLSRLVLAEAAGLISAINTGTNTVTVSAVPSTIVTGTVCDLVRGTPPFDNPALDLTATVSGSNITFASLPTGLAVGDYVALAGETPIPQLAPDLHPLLAKRTAFVIAGGSSAANAKALEADIKTLREAALTLLTTRVTEAPQPIVNRNGPGWRRRWL